MLLSTKGNVDGGEEGSVSLRLAGLSTGINWVSSRKRGAKKNHWQFWGLQQHREPTSQGAAPPRLPEHRTAQAPPPPGLEDGWGGG